LSNALAACIRFVRNVFLFGLEHIRDINFKHGILKQASDVE